MSTTVDAKTTVTRCGWAGMDGRMVAYHDMEWGVPLHNDQKLFEFLILEGAQAGLSWQTILSRRETYREAFHDFDPEKVAKYGEKDAARLLADPGIIRNRLKVRAAIQNAQAFLQVQHEFGSFAAYVWQFVDGIPVDHKLSSMKEVPVTTPESDAMSKDLKKRGFSFVGSTICYAFMQATGMVNDHLTSCFRHDQV